MQAGLAAGEAVPPEVVDLVKPHVQSFDYFLGDGLTRVVELLEPVEVWLVATLLCTSDSTVIRSFVAKAQAWTVCRSSIQSPDKHIAFGLRALL